MRETVKVKVFLRTNKVGSKCEETLEFFCEEWEQMTDDEKEAACLDAAFNMGEWGWEVEE